MVVYSLVLVLADPKLALQLELELGRGGVAFLVGFVTLRQVNLLVNGLGDTELLYHPAQRSILINGVAGGEQSERSEVCGVARVELIHAVG